jgi:hypothetical protein
MLTAPCFIYAISGLLSFLYLHEIGDLQLNFSILH